MEGLPTSRGRSERTGLIVVTLPGWEPLYTTLADVAKGAEDAAGVPERELSPEGAVKTVVGLLDLRRPPPAVATDPSSDKASPPPREAWDMAKSAVVTFRGDRTRSARCRELDRFLIALDDGGYQKRKMLNA